MLNNVRKPDNKHESYMPKKRPSILNMAEVADDLFNLQEVAPKHLIDSIFPTGDNPWVGGCNYLRCFISLQMYIDKIPYDQQANIRYALYRKYLAITGMGLPTIWQPKARWENYSFEAAHDYIRKSFTFVGYDYIEMKSNGKNGEDLNKIIIKSIHDNKPVLAAYNRNSIDNEPSRYNRLWRLFIGYDINNNTIMVNEDGDVKSLSDWYEGLENIIILTKTGLNRPDIKEVFSETIVGLEKLTINDIPYGHAAYEDCISFLENDYYFETASDKELDQIHKSLAAFFWFHAEVRGATGEGCGELCAHELNGTEYKTDINCNGFYGYNGHQTSNIGCMALRKGIVALKDKSIRNIFIYVIRMLMSNDAKIINQIKKAFNFNTPDVLSPKNVDGQPIDYCFHSKDMMMWADKSLIVDSCVENAESLTAETILAKCKILHSYSIDILKDVNVRDLKSEQVGQTLSVKGTGSIYDETGRIETKQSFHTPLKIDVCIENKETAFALYYNNGFVKNWSWGNAPGFIIVRDIHVDYVMDFNPEFSSIQTNEINISWILQHDFMAVLVNGELIHYSENFPYMHFDMPNASVGFSAFDNKTVIIKSLEISELT